MGSWLGLAAALLCAPGLGDGLGRLGGPAATIQRADAQAFSFPSPTLTATQRRAFSVGNALFKTNWVSAPASAAGRDGLGPLFNARSCSACHLRDGRGRPAERGEAAETGDLVRVALGGAPHPLYGGQLQDRAILGAQPEPAPLLEWEELPGLYPDGVRYSLRRPRWRGAGSHQEGLAYTALVAPHMIGLGLLEAVPSATLHALADPEDHDGDGISGRVHLVRDRRTGELAPGRFGWKASQPTVEQQVAAAFVHDIGITSSLFPEEPLSMEQLEQNPSAASEAPELDDLKLSRVTFYSQVLAVPAQRAAGEPEIRSGEEHFSVLGCAACHRPALRTGPEAVLSGYQSVEIHPYTDLLLHDLGAGLADGRPEGDASGSEWRTPPLWGVGLFDAVNGHSFYLHDGRARSLEEAVLWHGGEAARSRDAFMALSAGQRHDLLAFLASL